MDEEQRAEATGTKGRQGHEGAPEFEPSTSEAAAESAVAEASDTGTPVPADAGEADTPIEQTASEEPAPGHDAGPAPLTLLTLGTPHGSWSALARAALAAAPDGTWLDGRLGAWLDGVLGPDGERWPEAAPAKAAPPVPVIVPDGTARWGALDERACWALDALVDGLPKARFLVFVDTPEAALAAWLRSGAAGSAESALARWTAGARRLLEHSARARPRFTFVSAAAASRDPGLLTNTLQRLLGAASGEWRSPEVTPDLTPDVTIDRVAAALAADSTEAQAVGEALLALCTAPAAGGGLRADHEARSLVERLRGVAGAPAGAPERRQLELDALEHALRSQREAATKARTELRRERAAHARTGAELEAARGKLGTANMERAVVIRQVLDTQRELARYFGECRRLELSAGPVSARIRANRVVFGPTVSDGPHRHIDAQAHGLRSPSQELHDQLVRLVEHHGRPGIALLNARGKPAPLGLWEPNIDDSAHTGLLIVPADAPSRALLERLGTADWITVLGLVNLLETELAISRVPQAAAWRVVAGRLLMQLRELPPRLRYDRCTITASDAGDAQSPVLKVELASPMYDDEPLAPVTLEWRPASRWRGGSAATAPLHWLHSRQAGVAPSLPGWPVDDEGSPAVSLALPVGAGIAADAKRQRWAAFSPREREVLLGLLDALCGAAASAGTESGLPVGWDAARLSAAAAGLRADAHATLRGVRLRQIVRRIAKRKG